MPFFSIVIPLYNKGPWIGDTLNSVLNQSFQDFELVVVDNGSTDNGASVVRSFADSRIRLIQQENKGVSHARNVGIQAAQAVNIAFLDADDLWGPNFLEQIHTLLELFPDASAYGCQYAFKKGETIFPPHHPLLSPKKLQLISNYFEQVTIGDMLLTASSVCIPKNMLTRVGLFPEGERIGEDQDLWARLALAGPIAFHATCAAYYRQDISGMATAARPEATLWPFVNRLLQLVRSGQLPADQSQAVEKYAVKHLLGQASQLVLDGQQEAAQTLLALPEARLAGKRYWYWRLINQMPALLRSYLSSRHARNK